MQDLHAPEVVGLAERWASRSLRLLCCLNFHSRCLSSVYAPVHSPSNHGIEVQTHCSSLPAKYLGNATSSQLTSLKFFGSPWHWICYQVMMSVIFRLL